MEAAAVEALRSKSVAITSAAFHLAHLGLCSRCLMRFLNVREKVYTEIAPFPGAILEKLQQAGVASPEVTQAQSGKKDTAAAELQAGLEGAEEIGCEVDNEAQQAVNVHEGQICIVCLGFLHCFGTAESRGPTFDSIMLVVKEGCHEFDSFCLEVTIPALLLVRETAMWYHLQQVFEPQGLFQGGLADSTVSLKEAYKWSIIEPLESILAVPFISSSAYRISLLYTHVASSAEARLVAGWGGLGRSKRRREDRGRRGKNGSHAREDGVEGEERGRSWLRDGGDGTEVVGHASVAATRIASDDGETRAAVQRAIAGMSRIEFAGCYPCPPMRIEEPCQLIVTCWRQPLFIGGRYLKLSRTISQSRWVIDDERVGEGSVQEVVADPLVEASGADSYKFHSAGREDIDVRMLGRGRPFLVELLNPHRTPSAVDLAEIEAQINSSEEQWAEVRALRVRGTEAAVVMREGEADKQKSYLAVVWISRPVTAADVAKLNATRDLVLSQRTPVRVLHRRSGLVRERIVHSMRAEPVLGNTHYLLLHLCTQAGTYVKEFVHGDFGRTVPSIGSLLEDCEADIIQLDVEDIMMDFE